MTDSYSLAAPAAADQSAYLEPYNSYSLKYENARQIAAGRSLLLGLTVFSSNVASQWVQLFDSLTLPADGTPPVWIQTVAATGNLGFLWIPGRVFEAGIWACNSTTGPTKTIGAADCYFDAQWIPVK